MRAYKPLKLNEDALKEKDATPLVNRRYRLYDKIKLTARTMDIITGVICVAIIAVLLLGILTR
ncbi:MAG: hypothetical protein LBS18_06390 [Clostridiales bacterium]|jgi:hypothetical protein|nr:hypothetical protein [Clostridiales bacterium]